MKLNEYYFSEYYHQFLTIEADVLTDRFSDRIEVTEEDCYALCSGFVNEEGMAAFAVLSIGPSWEHCTKGLEQEDMLGFLTMEEVEEKEARLVEADLDMVEKNDLFLESAEPDVDETLYDLRLNGILDGMRDILYPDVVPAQMLSWDGFETYAVELQGMQAQFVYGTVEESLDEGDTLAEGDTVWMVPASIEEDPALIIVYSGEHMTDEIMEQMQIFLDALPREDEAAAESVLPN
ncbi:MAG: hypothetical protein IKG46_12840 [Solobacterium sp.]|nr:hypothetical protein [Solobacterium sp.]